MLIGGRWKLEPDGELRPVIEAAVRRPDGSWVGADFLVDSGADRTVLTAEVLNRSGLAPVASAEHLVLCLLGRDLTNFFAVIVDRPQDVVCLLGQNHRYAIVTP
jgi:hypothetical protein